MVKLLFSRTFLMPGFLEMREAFISTPLTYPPYRPTTNLDMGTLTIYGEPGSRSPTINWAAYELDLPFVNAQNDYTNSHPFRQISCLVDDDVIVFESAAILIHLVSKIKPMETQRYAAIVSWITWANTSLDSICFVYKENGLM
jgi:Glutathione S-transferase, N-terminal domain